VSANLEIEGDGIALPRGTVSLERVRAGERLIRELQERAIVARLFGGAAVVLHCPRTIASGPHREIGDLDVVVKKEDARSLARALPALGYEPELRFNAVHGSSRLLFHGPTGKLDVFIGSFRMCHEIRLAGRLELDYPTLTASDLLLTKLQVFELNAKDEQDAVALLQEHPLRNGPGDQIDLLYLGNLMSSDWGLWRTITGTLRKIAESNVTARPAADALLTACLAVPKSRSFKLRARIGDHVQWYELPEDLA
jgi:hypothetical protein